MKAYLSLLSVVFVLSFIGCSGKSEKSDNKMQNESEMTEQSNAQMEPSGQAKTIDVYGIDNMKFVVKEKKDFLDTGEEMTVKGDTYYLLNGMTAQAGQELTVNLHTISSLPASAMSHNWCLVKMDTDVEAFATAGATDKQNDYIPSKMEDQVIKETGLVAGGKSKSITFTVPGDTGEYSYLCTFPGHYTSGMKGTLTVE